MVEIILNVMVLMNLGRLLVMIACNLLCLNGSFASYGVAQITIHSQVACLDTGVANAYMAMYHRYLLWF
jgi:hypothetical protein